MPANCLDHHDGPQCPKGAKSKHDLLYHRNHTNHSIDQHLFKNSYSKHFKTISTILSLNIHGKSIILWGDSKIPFDHLSIRNDLPVLEPNWAKLHDLLHQLAFCQARNLFSKLPTLELYVSTTIFPDEISWAQRWERHGSKGSKAGLGGWFFFEWWCITILDVKKMWIIKVCPLKLRLT